MAKRKSVTKFNEQPASPLDALIRKLDIVAVEMETKWGMGVLHGLCTPETSAKFMRVKDALDLAIQGGDYDLVKAKSESLIRGWQLMDREATEADHGNQKKVEAWYVCSPENNDIQYIVVRHEGDAALAAAQNPSKASSIYTLSDISRLIDNASLAIPLREKRYFKEVAEGKPKPTWSNALLEDSIPF